ncbi:MAG: UDP-N-acetylmuramate--L-alanine ligase [Flavobacteriales bacterium]|nr:MAG: UDP-N-acetylmuramate--L-alanine ligase [Flavobacteriales bacterium]
MRNIENIESFYFIGIGGIGMSALARYFHLREKQVFGYDKTPTNLTKTLIREGISIQFDEEIYTIPEEVKRKDKSLIIRTPAVPESNQLLSWFRSEDYLIFKRSEVLGELSKNSFCIAVAGTHGKTTTSAILSHLLAYCNMPITAFLGGITENYNSNLIYKGDEIIVIEADEFDRSFLYLNPDIACITSMDADHLDIYKSENKLEKTFIEFSTLVSNPNNLLFKKGLPLEGHTVSTEDAADYQAKNIRVNNGSYVFDLKTPTEEIKNLQFNLPGRHNMFNAVTALGMAILVGVPTDCLSKALKTFRGVKRRFSYKIKTNNLILIDDYAHHPTEIDALHQAVTEMYPDTKKQIVFQPHLFSRTRDFGVEFARSLSAFDEIILLDIYPAREKPIEGITSSWLLKMINSDGKALAQKSQLSTLLKDSDCMIKLMVGAGDIGAEVAIVAKNLDHEN